MADKMLKNAVKISAAILLSLSFIACGAMGGRGAGEDSPQGDEGQNNRAAQGQREDTKGEALSAGDSGEEAGVAAGESAGAGNTTGGAGAESATGGAEGAFETVVFSDDDYEFEVPVGWEMRPEMSDAEATPRIYFFAPEDVDLSGQPSNLVAEIHEVGGFDADKSELAEPEVQESFFDYIYETVIRNKNGIINVEYSVIEEADRYLYVVEYDRDTGDGIVIHQTCYYAMGFDVPVVFYATDYGDTLTPPVSEAARRAAASFRLREN